MNKWIYSGLLAVAVLVGGIFALNPSVSNSKQVMTVADYKDAEYIIDGTRIKLENGVAETEAAPDRLLK